MSEELETELIDKSIGTLYTGIDCIKEDVKKFQTSQDSLEKLVQEKYQTLHEDLENVTSEVKDVEIKLGTVDDRLNTIDKSIGTLYTGIDCIKEDVKKFQISQDSLEKFQISQDSLEKLVLEKFKTSQDSLEKFQISQDSLEKLVQERYQTLHEDLENVTSEVKDVEVKLGTVDDRLNKTDKSIGKLCIGIDKSIGTVCTGIDSIKEDVKKFQTSQDSLEKLVQEKIPVLSGNIENVISKVKDIETKLGTVDDRLDTIDKSMEIFCTGIDCIMEDVKKFQTSQDSLEKLVQEKIPALYGNIDNVTREVKGVEIKLGTIDDRLSTVDKSIETLHTGIDCINEDAKKFQASQDSLEKLVQEKYQTLHEDLEKSHDVLEKLVQERFEELGEKVQSLERPTFVCENCGEQTIAPLSSYCSNCGSEIQSWSDEDGQPVRGWTPYWKRPERSASH